MEEGGEDKFSLFPFLLLSSSSFFLPSLHFLPLLSVMSSESVSLVGSRGEVVCSVSGDERRDMSVLHRIASLLLGPPVAVSLVPGTSSSSSSHTATQKTVAETVTVTDLASLISQSLHTLQTHLTDSRLARNHHHIIIIFVIDEQQCDPPVPTRGAAACVEDAGGGGACAV